MTPLTILVTGSGAPGIAGTVYSLRHNFDGRPVTIIGTDVQEDAVGKYLCDCYFRIPPVIKTESYLAALIEICQTKKVDVLLPQNTAELLILSSKKAEFESLGTKIVVSNEKSIKLANDKFRLMNVCRELKVPYGKFFLVNTIGDLKRHAQALGWPDVPVVIKPPISNGLRGVRIIDESIDLKKMFYDEKPTSLFTRMEDIEKILGEAFPDLVVMEYMPGKEYTVDVLRTEGKTWVIPRIRTLIRSGITFQGVVENNGKIIEYSKRIAEKLDLEYCFGFQFKLDKTGQPKILESNPRVQGTMVLATLAGANIIYAAVKSVLREPIEDFQIKWDTKLLRYWGAVGVNGGDAPVFL